MLKKIYLWKKVEKKCLQKANTAGCVPLARSVECEKADAGPPPFHAPNYASDSWNLHDKSGANQNNIWKPMSGRLTAGQGRTLRSPILFYSRRKVICVIIIFLLRVLHYVSNSFAFYDSRTSILFGFRIVYNPRSFIECLPRPEPRIFSLEKQTLTSRSISALYTMQNTWRVFA